MKHVLGIFFFCFSIISFTAQAATVFVEDGQLKGADGIVFEGYSASVRLVEGSCVDQFNGCDEASDLVFQSLTGDITAAKDLAVLANQALLEQVFNANPLYDFNVDLTFGCGEGEFIRLIRCSLLTPYYLATDTSVLTASLTNRDDNTGELDTVGFGQGYNILDATFPSIPNRPDRVVYASWDLTPAAVPVPAAAPLFLTAMLFLGLCKRRKTA